MKKYLYMASVISVLGLTSCDRDQFLTTEPTETTGNPLPQYKLNGLYLMMITPGTGGTTNSDGSPSDDDLGQKGYDIFSDLLSSDMVLGALTYGWYSNIASLDAPQNFTSTINYKPWRYYYRLINGANDVIDGLGGNENTPSDKDNKYAMGQAKAIRGYAYFNLMQLYNPKYDPSAKSIPLYLKSGTKAKDLATQAEVYKSIIDDLTQSVSLLDGFTRQNKGMVNKYVAEGFLAYAYAAMGDDINASKAALDIINNSGYAVTTKTDLLGGFNSLTTPSWMWGFDITNDNGMNLKSWWGQVDIFTYSYAWAGDPKEIDLGLYAQIKDGDIRKDQFVTVNETEDGFVTTPADEDGDYPAVPANKFYAPARKIGGQRTVTTDYLYMRIDEFYLLAAETLAKSGQEAQAKQILKGFLKTRMDNVDYVDSLTGTALQKEIYLQTRIEFWGEGKSYFAMKRNKATITRGPNHLFFAGQSFSYDDTKLTLKVPQQEITNNPNLPK